MSDTGIRLIDERDRVSAIVFSAVVALVLLVIVTPAVWPLWEAGGLAAIIAAVVLFANSVSGVFERHE